MHVGALFHQPRLSTSLSTPSPWRIVLLNSKMLSIRYAAPTNLPSLPANAIQLTTQFVASLWYLNRHHDYQTLSPKDIVRQDKKVEGEPEREKEGTTPQSPRHQLQTNMLQLNLTPQTSSAPDKRNLRKTLSSKNNKLNT